MRTKKSPDFGSFPKSGAKLLQKKSIVVENRLTNRWIFDDFFNDNYSNSLLRLVFDMYAYRWMFQIYSIMLDNWFECYKVCSESVLTMRGCILSTNRIPHSSCLQAQYWAHDSRVGFLRVRADALRRVLSKSAQAALGLAFLWWKWIKKVLLLDHW